MEKKTDIQKIIGAWRLISSQKMLSDGSVIDVFGENPTGYIIFTEQRVMSVQIMRRERENFHGENLLNDYLAYTGHYSLDEHEKVVTFQVETSLSAEYLGKEVKRGYQYENDQLVLKVLESDIDYRVTWERAR